MCVCVCVCVCADMHVSAFTPHQCSIYIIPVYTLNTLY